jgi:UDP-glucose 4-epimerase
MTNYILVTGGLGFIGSHVVVQLIELGYNVLVFDNLSNSSINVVAMINHITKRPELLKFIEGDVRNTNELSEVFANHRIVRVAHFAALKSVGESQKFPELYHQVNVLGTINLLSVMRSHGCVDFIFSSSATVYGSEGSGKPVDENSTTGIELACNYAKNKYDVERYLIDNHLDGGLLAGWNIVILRYFNPLGAHPSGIIGEDPNGIPNNIFPYLLRVARWTNHNNLSDKNNESPYKIFTIFGADYPTPDGTCIRDYVHVQDLARAHVEIISHMDMNMNDGRLHIYNVGTGTGSSVLQLVHTMNEVLAEQNKQPIQYQIGSRREGDLCVSYANVEKIYKEIGFKTKYDIKKMCVDGLKFVGV